MIMEIELSTAEGNGMTSVEAYLLALDSTTYTPYYNGKMSYKLHGASWEKYVSEAFPDLAGQTTSENIFKTVIDLYAENLVPDQKELKGFSNVLVPLLSRGECPVLVDSAGTPHFPERYEMISDGEFTVAALFTRSLKTMTDNVIFADSDGTTRLFSKAIPTDFSQATKEGYTFKEEEHGASLFRFALDDKGFGAMLSALQDRVNHSIIDQTVIAEMYARPFWYLLNVDIPPKNPFLPAGAQPERTAMTEHKDADAAGRIFTSSGEGPFGQLTPPTIQDMIAYHDSIIDKIPQSFGIPAHYFKPGQGTPPTGVALKVLSKRFNNKVARLRDDIYETMALLADEIGLKPTMKNEDTGEMEHEFWPASDDLLQESLDAHGIALSQMGYPLEYIASVVTPGVDLDDYEEEDAGPELGTDPSAQEPTDMTATGQQGLVATPGQVAAYGQNPGQRAKATR
ncbi:portal protein [Microbacterium phage Sansa]|uniref:Portal protein n=1 Tax=Microbacterium phage Sansa TaxID=2250298 RepID=A0A345KZX3_9CAUD|nr:portal protein [Microbacterium phage Sansa]